jgi:hypothetical protein
MRLPLPGNQFAPAVCHVRQYPETVNLQLVSLPLTLGPSSLPVRQRFVRQSSTTPTVQSSSFAFTHSPRMTMSSILCSRQNLLKSFIPPSSGGSRGAPSGLGNQVRVDPGGKFATPALSDSIVLYPTTLLMTNTNSSGLVFAIHTVSNLFSGCLFRQSGSRSRNMQRS